MAEGDDPKWEKDHFTVAIHVPERDDDPFPFAQRTAFLELIRGGVRDRNDAIKILGTVPKNTVLRYIRDGQDKVGLHTEKGQQRYLFYLDLLAAEAARNTMGDTVIMKEVQRGNYKAAEAWNRRSERLAEQPSRLRILKAEADEREAAAEAAKQRARIMTLQAQILERKDETAPDMVLFPPHAVERLRLQDPAKAAALQALLADAGMVMAPTHVVNSVVKGHDDHMAAENDRLAKDLGLDVAPPVDVDAEDVPGEQG